LWVSANEANFFTVSSQQVKRFGGKLNVCQGKQELATFKSVLWEKHNRSKISCG